ncbi:MAG: tRNA (adenosine(37)-N6)-threonylcarbamoyltransferase complex dimerization subunit type 1 TsaB [Lentisphaerae bacterium]|nr:tRNA (adenosine(37)-N6)-threonylcarbamoyltransferase complex dimerization subunit type 1 TsaB [Lentisphaerota bacterium]
MFILAIDQSTATGSSAVLADQRLIAARHWHETRTARQQIFPCLNAILHEARLEPSAIELYVAGVGPGSYSGLRVAVAAITAMALPGKTAVYGVTSAEAIAWQVAQAENVTKVRIVGDARAERWWTRLFLRQDDLMSPAGEWELVDPGVFKVGAAEVVATPDWPRLEARLPAMVPASTRLIARAVFPEAETLARLAAARRARGIASEPLIPIYLHPAVRRQKASA